MERLGYNPRAGAIILDIYYYGNCLINLEEYNNRSINYYSVYPIDWDNFNDSVEGELLKPEAVFFLVRGEQIKLSHNKKDYYEAGIELKEYEPNSISIEEAGRLLVTKYGEYFRATDQELYKSVPDYLPKILVLDQWYHKDFDLQLRSKMTDEQLRQTYEFNKNLTGLAEMNFVTFVASTRRQEELLDNWNKEQIDNNRPSTYETWQLLAKVIETGNAGEYKPTLEPNTHWSNWQESGTL